MKSLDTIIFNYLENYPPSLELFRKLKHAGNLYLIGGVLREYRDRGELRDLRDIDIIIDIRERSRWEEILETHRPKKNSFGGYKLVCSALIVDIWPLEETWAYREGYVVCKPEEYAMNLPKTVFLNLDAIIYDFNKDIWYDEKYLDAMNSRVIDVVLEKNPWILLNIVRAMVLKKRYGMSFSDGLRKIIREQMNLEKDFTGRLLEIQEERYKKVILSGEEIEKELEELG